jgi:hypothetical protein
MCQPLGEQDSKASAGLPLLPFDLGQAIAARRREGQA